MFVNNKMKNYQTYFTQAAYFPIFLRVNILNICDHAALRTSCEMY